MDGGYNKILRKILSYMEEVMELFGSSKRNRQRIFQAVFAGNIGRQIWATLGLLIIYRLLLNIPLPGITSLQTSTQQTANSLFTMVSFVDMLSAGSLLKTSILGLGLFPFQIADLLLGLILLLVPSLKERVESDSYYGKRLLEKWQLLLAIPLGIIESMMFISLATLNCSGQNFITLIVKDDILVKVVIVIILLTGSFFAVWIAWLISEIWGSSGRGGLGAYILIFGGIAGSLPSQIAELVSKPNIYLNLIAYVILFVGTIIVVIYLQGGKRNIPLLYRKRQTEKINAFGETPLLLSLSFATEGLVGSQLLIALATFYAPLVICANVPWINKIAYFAISIFPENGFLFGPIAFLSVFIFTPLYASVKLEEKDYPKNLRKSFLQIPGVKYEATAKYLATIMNRLSPSVGIILGILAITPWALNMITGTELSLLDGEKIIIAVSTVTSITMTIKANLFLDGYGDTFRL